MFQQTSDQYGSGAVELNSAALAAITSVLGVMSGVIVFLYRSDRSRLEKELADTKRALEKTATERDIYRELMLRSTSQADLALMKAIDAVDVAGKVIRNSQ